MAADGTKILGKFFNEHPEVQFLRIQILDYASVVRVQVLPKKRALAIAAQGFCKAPLHPTSSTLTVANGAVLSSVKPALENWDLDWSSLRVCCWRPNHASVMCFARHTAISDEETLVRKGHSLDPRGQLQQQLELAGDIKFQVGFEVEFLIMEKDKSHPAEVSALGSDGLRSKFLAVVEEIVTALDKVGIEIAKFHTEETCEGVFEIVLLPDSPMSACDTLVYCHEAIKSIAENAGYHATMFPKPFETGGPYIGSHLNLSISDKSDSKDTQFLGGILEHIPALHSIIAPSLDSYSRTTRRNKFATWGVEFKISTVRHCMPTNHWEIRHNDATANPYLAVTAVIIAGMNGIRKQQPLTVKPLTNISQLDDEKARKEMGIVTRLPESLAEALRELEKDEVLRDEEFGFGKGFVEAYLALKRQELEDWKGVGVEKRREVSLRVF